MDGYRIDCEEECNTENGQFYMKVLVKIAAYDEEKNLGHVLKQMPDNIDVLVIDDGSTDRTSAIALEHGAHLIKHPVNLGQGAADITGFMWALENDYDIVIEMDGDGQHSPNDIPRFIEHIAASGADIVTGSRIRGSAHEDNSQIRRFFLPTFTRIINIATGYELTDGMCGFKLYKMSVIREHRDIFHKILEPQYLASELYIRFARRGLTVEEIPIHVDKRMTGQSRKGLVKYGVRVLGIILFLLVERYLKTSD